MVDKLQTLKCAQIIKRKINLALNGEISERHRDEIDIAMRPFPQEIFRKDKILSYAIVDVKKFLGDIDIRENDSKYDEYLREKLKSYINEIDLIISR